MRHGGSARQAAHNEKKAQRMPQLQSVEIPAPHGMLEGLLRLPDTWADAGNGVPRLAAVVCHPHPVYGGTMHTKAVFRIAQALVELGFPTLRFNFRGVGRSTGRYDNGRGERDDVRSALDYLAATFPGSPLALGGFSFGSWVALPVGCADPRVIQLIGAGVPLASLPVDALAACARYKLIVQGEQDEYGPKAELVRWFATVAEPKDLRIIAGADHFFTHQQAELTQAVTSYFQEGRSALGML
jgi:alpha/beta superfamily hydrolase